MSKSRMTFLVCTLVAGLLGSDANAANLETVSVGNPGNSGDPRYPDTATGVYSFGSVAYAYNIGKYEVTAVQYTEFLNAVAKTDAYGLYNTRMDTANDIYGCNIKRSGVPGSYSYSVSPDWADRPVNNVGWGDVARFANWMHNGQPTGDQDASTTEDGSYVLNGMTSFAALLAVTRKGNATWVIPTEDEWYKAAYHKNDGVTGNYWNYPTSTNLEPGRDMTDASGNNANYEGRTGSYPIDSDKYTTVVGEFQNSLSPYGTFDQGGNVAEWNETVISRWRGMRGGAFSYFLTTGLHAISRDYYGGESPALGFRLAYVPEPATLTTLSLGCLAVLRRRVPPAVI